MPRSRSRGPRTSSCCISITGPSPGAAGGGRGAAAGPGLYGVACSGGADSMTLADAAIEIAGASNVVVLHIDHGLQPGSGEVGAGVAAWARARGAAAVVRAVEVGRRASIEAAAR